MGRRAELRLAMLLSTICVKLYFPHTIYVLKLRSSTHVIRVQDRYNPQWVRFT